VLWEEALRPPAPTTASETSLSMHTVCVGGLRAQKKEGRARHVPAAASMRPARFATQQATVRDGWVRCVDGSHTPQPHPFHFHTPHLTHLLFRGAAAPPGSPPVTTPFLPTTWPPKQQPQHRRRAHLARADLAGLLGVCDHGVANPAHRRV